MLGTKRPSMMSTWIQSAPAVSTAATSAPSRPKSAESTDGATIRRRVMGLDRSALAGRLDVAAEAVAHGREQLLAERVLAAGAEPGEEGGRQHVGRHRLLDRGLHRPA